MKTDTADARQVLENFAQTARDERDIAALTAELVKVIQETMQPETTSLVLLSAALKSQRASE